VNPTDNKLSGKVTMADEIDTRKAIRAANGLHTFSQSSRNTGWSSCQRLHDAGWPRMDQLLSDGRGIRRTANRAKGSKPRGEHFPALQESLEDFDLVKTVGTSKVVMEPAGVGHIYAMNSSAGSIGSRWRDRADARSSSKQAR